MKKYDVIVIGGGPAGLMAAGRASELGAKVLLLEKNENLGIKLLMTGGGRCNFTNQSRLSLLAKSLGYNGSWLLSGLNYFGPDEVINFFIERGVEVKVEDDSRVFPASNKARDILQVLIDYAQTNGVEIRTKLSVVEVVRIKNKILKLILSDQTEVSAKKFILASGGKSYPLSGSSGEAFEWLKELGHTIIQTKAALSQIITQEAPLELEGLTLTNVELGLYQDGKKINKETGDFIFTSRGLSGPAALNLSRLIVKQGISNLEVRIDFFPYESRERLDIKIQNLLRANQKNDLKNILSQLLPKRLINFILRQAKINPDKKGGGVNRVERQILIDLFKTYNFSVLGVGGFDEAIITVGGVDLKEVDAKTMGSKIISNLYLAGECLDLDGPTGGYNLQIAWTSAYLAGENATQTIIEK